MPEWASFVVGAAAFFGAATLLWTKGVKPLIRLASDHDKLERQVVALEERVRRLEHEG